MKSIVLSVLVFLGLTGAVVIGTRGDGPRPGGKGIDREAMDLLVTRLESLEQRLGSLDQLERRLDQLAGQVATVDASHRTDPTKRASAEERSEPAKGRRAPRDDEELRDYIVRVMDDVREEKLAEQRRQAEERRRELIALNDGPYGVHNFKVNTMAKRLELSDRQKEHYYLNLVEYNQLIQRSRENESQDKENRQQYRDERKRIRGEFSQVILSSLTPQQAETFSSLPSHEQQPDGSAGYRYITSFTTVPGMAPAQGEAILDFVPEEAAYENATTVYEHIASEKSLADVQAQLEKARALEVEARLRAEEARKAEARARAEEDARKRRDLREASEDPHP